MLNSILKNYVSEKRIAFTNKKKDKLKYETRLFSAVDSVTVCHYKMFHDIGLNYFN